MADLDLEAIRGDPELYPQGRLIEEIERLRANIESELRTHEQLCAERASLKRRITALRGELLALEESRCMADYDDLRRAAREARAADDARRRRFERKARGR